MLLSAIYLDSIHPMMIVAQWLESHFRGLRRAAEATLWLASARFADGMDCDVPQSIESYYFYPVAAVLTANPH